MRNVNRTLLILAMLIPALGIAQSPENSWDNLKQLRVGEKIQVVDQKLKSYTGTFVGVTEEAISFQVGRDAVTVERPDVFRVTSRERTRRRRNALIGLGIGAAAGVAGMVIALEKATNGPVYYDGEGAGPNCWGCHRRRGNRSRDWSSLSQPSDDLPLRATKGSEHPLADVRSSFENSSSGSRASASAWRP